MSFNLPYNLRMLNFVQTELLNLLSTLNMVQFYSVDASLLIMEHILKRPK